MRVGTRAAAALAAAAVLGGCILLGAALARPDHATAFAPGGGGAHPFVADAQGRGLAVERVLSSPAAALRGVEPSATLLVVFEARDAYAPHEQDAVESFLRAGGRVLLADPFGAAGTLSQGLGVSFERVRLVDPQAHEGTSVARIDGGDFDVAWTNPSALRVTPGLEADILAQSGEASFLDRDGDGTIDAADPQGTFPLAASIPVGKGLLLAVADRGAFTAAGAQEADNALWRRALLDHLLPDGGRVLVDESRHAGQNAAAVALGGLWEFAATPGWTAAMLVLCALLLGVPLLPRAAQMLRAHRFRPERFVRRQDLGATASSERPREGAAWTPRGWAVWSAAAALFAAGIATGSGQAIGASCILAMALGAAATQRPPRATAKRSLTTDRPAEGTPVRGNIHLQAKGRKAADLEIQERLPEEFEITGGQAWFRARVPPGASGMQAEYTVTPALRGPYVVGPLLARRSDVLALRTQATVLCEGQPIQVAPRQESVRRIPFTTRVPTITLGPHLVNRAGDGSEFHALRDYARGDSMRSVNWKASARAGELMVNQRVHESMTRLTILLDCRAVSAAGPSIRSPLAVGARVALSVAAGALRVRDRVQFLAYGDGILRLPASPGSRQLHDLREVLSGLPARGSTPLQDAVDDLGATIKPNTPVLIVSGLEGDDTFVEAVRALRNRGALPVVIAPPIGVDVPHDEPEEGAEDLRAGRERTVAGLRALGVPVHETAQGLPLDDLFRIGGHT